MFFRSKSCLGGILVSLASLSMSYMDCIVKLGSYWTGKGHFQETQQNHDVSANVLLLTCEKSTFPQRAKKKVGLSVF